MISLLSRSVRARRVLVAFGVICGFLCVLPLPSACAAGDKNKDKAPKEKKAKVYTWTEVSNDHFVVTTDGGEGLSRHVLEQFEQLREVFATALPNARLDTGVPMYILAAKDSNGFAAMLPEYPVEKRREQPYGLFFAGNEKNYIAMRLNAAGIAPYQDVYQQYARTILRQSYRNLPPWLEEGYINVFTTMDLTPKGARIERPDPEDLSILFESPLLPLNLVLQADRRSAYYASGDRHTVYYAESDALAHFLLSDPELSSEKILGKYLTLTEGGADPLQAARESFGDLDQLQSKLEAYVKQTAARGSFEMALDSTPSIGDVTTHTLTAPEAEARFGDCELARGRLDDARAKLEEAIQLQPSMPEGEESLGFTLLEQKEIGESAQHFSTATQLDPRDGLAFYGLGLVSLAQASGVGIPVSAIDAFEKSVALIPDYAPAWSNLAMIYAERPDTLPKALTAAQKAASLAPGEGSYQYLLAEILQDMGRNDDARKVATQLHNSSDDNRLADRAGDLLARNSTPSSGAAGGAVGGPPVLLNKSGTAGSSSSAPSTPAPSPTTPSVPTLSTGPPPPPVLTPSAAPAPTATPQNQSVSLERRTDTSDAAPRRTASGEDEETAPPAAPPVIAAQSSRIYSMVGTIAEAACATTKGVLLTLKAQTIVMHLHAADVSQLIRPAGSSSSTASASTAKPAKPIPCASLRGRNARISYQLSPNQSWDGEIQTIELRN